MRLSHSQAPGEILQHAGELRLRAARLTRSEPDAKDLVQDTFERALRSWHHFQPGTNLRSWLFRIMFNLHVDHCRASRRSAPPLESQPADPLPPPDADTEPAWTQLTMDDVRRATDGLGPPLKTVLELSVRGLSYQQIAGELGVPMATVSVRLWRARRKLREVLQSREEGEPPTLARKKGQEVGSPTSCPPMFLEQVSTARAPTRRSRTISPLPRTTEAGITSAGLRQNV